MESLDIIISHQKQMDIISEVASPLVVITEMIKNAFDEHAKEITVDINETEVIVTDNGNGFSEEAIKMLSRPGESYKKKENKILNPHNKVFAGSMGIGLFSIFSIADKFEIVTKGPDGTFNVYGDQSHIKYERTIKEPKFNGVTQIKLINVSNSDIKVLVEDVKNDKLKHISLNNYKKEYDLFELMININGILQTTSSPFIEDLYTSTSCNFTSKISFSYSKEKRELTYSYERKDDPFVNYEPITISFNHEINLSRILNEHYHITRIERIEEFNFLPLAASSVCDFEGAFYVKEGSKGYKEISNFGSAIRIYVNGFGMYNYLERQKDWLNLSELTANVKNSGIKPKNTLGYISFNHFIEADEELEISKERSHFYDKVPYRTFYEMVYKIVTLLSFNIDVASRNNRNVYFDKEYITHYTSKKRKSGPTSPGPTNPGPTSPGPTNPGPTNPGPTSPGPTNPDPTSPGPTNPGPTNPGPTNPGPTNPGPTNPGPTNPGPTNPGPTNPGPTNPGPANPGPTNPGPTSGGPTPGGQEPGSFFENISWRNLNPNNTDHIGLIISLDELYRMSNNKIRNNHRHEKIYYNFPVAAGMLLRTAYEQALILQLKKVDLWNEFNKGDSYPTLSAIESFIRKNKDKVLTNKDVNRSFFGLMTIKSRNFLNTNIHNPGLIRTSPSTLEGIINGGMYSLISGIIQEL